MACWQQGWLSTRSARCTIHLFLPSSLCSQCAANNVQRHVRVLIFFKDTYSVCYCCLVKNDEAAARTMGVPNIVLHQIACHYVHSQACLRAVKAGQFPLQKIYGMRI